MSNHEKNISIEEILAEMADETCRHTHDLYNIISTFKDILLEGVHHPEAKLRSPDLQYERFSQYVNRLSYTAEDIETFTNESLATIMETSDKIRMQGLYAQDVGDSLGLYISALINNLREKTTLNLNPFPLKLGFLGYQLGRNQPHTINIKGITSDVGIGMMAGHISIDGICENGLGAQMSGGDIDVDGCAYGDIGSGMRSGRIKVNGRPRFRKDTGDEGKGWRRYNQREYETSPKGLAENVGYGMQGGRIEITSDISGWLGVHMQGGEIHVKGDARDDVCRMMKGGKVIIEGDVADYLCQDMDDGDVYIKGSARDFASYNMISGRLTVEGNAGRFLCLSMKGGDVRILGDCDHNAGDSMEGGKLIIEGSAADSLGKDMKQGSIEVYGPAKGFGSFPTGKGMSGGDITIGEDLGTSLGKAMTSGEIYVKGDAGACVGEDSIGRIYVEGRCGPYAGKGMRNGVLEIGRGYDEPLGDRQYGWIIVNGNII